MSENRTDTSGSGQPDGRRPPERDEDEFEADTGYQPSTNQARDEPLPASHHDESRQESARRRGEPARDEPAHDGRPPRGGDQDPPGGGRGPAGQGK